MSRSIITRRSFLAKSLALSGVPLLWSYGRTAAESKQGAIRFGICADVHKDLVPDADARLKTFVDRMNHEKVDFIVQLGDFCQPAPRNDGFMAIWRSFQGPGYHVLGNHDMDGGFTRDQTVAYWEIPGKFYTFDGGHFRFIVLDGNDKKDPPQTGYARYMGEAQQQWLREQLEKTDRPVIVFSHQALHEDGGVENGAEVRRILEAANAAAGKRKVLACFNGHHHIDNYRPVDGIDYIHVNSMSYFWMGSKYKHTMYSDEIHKAYPVMKYTAPYRDPVFAIVSIEPDGTIRIEGTWSDWIGSSPSELGYPVGQDNRVVPGIANRTLEVNPF